ncbi:hypothetical protein JCM15519_00970 [Fundidesulfovibrio butyratiphilus]
MDGKTRAARWRARQVADGGKPIGVTLTAEAAQALDHLQETFKWSQREAISCALVYAAQNPHQLEERAAPGKVALLSVPAANTKRIEELERRLEQLESQLENRQPDGPAPLTPQESAEENKRRLLHFTAEQMLEHGERMSRVQLYARALRQGLDLPDTQHGYNVFISYHMELIRDIMRSLKEGNN